jgi:hypothetical protein
VEGSINKNKRINRGSKKKMPKGAKAGVNRLTDGLDESNESIKPPPPPARHAAALVCRLIKNDRLIDVAFSCWICDGRLILFRLPPIDII